MRPSILLALIALPSLLQASAEVGGMSQTLDERLAQAQSEARAADTEVTRLEKAAAGAKNAALRLRAQQLASAQAIAAAEARISAADAEIRLIAARQKALKDRLEREQQPLSALLGGLASMAGRPPLLSLVGADSTEELVRVRVLVDTTLPVIRARTAGLRGQLTAGAQLQAAAATARERLRQSRAELGAKRQQFAQLEEKAIAAAAATQARALQAGDVALAASETLDVLGGDAEQARAAAAIASELAREAPPPSGPGSGQAVTVPPFDYILPSQAPVLVGLGTVSASGVRSRGILLATARGATIAAPGPGTIRFAGPFRDYDGVIIIDHGGGWLSLIVNVATTLKRGDKVEVGTPLGRALGQIEVELSHRGRRLSPALIAGSSAALSNMGEDS